MPKFLIVTWMDDENFTVKNDNELMDFIRNGTIENEDTVYLISAEFEVKKGKLVEVINE